MSDDLTAEERALLEQNTDDGEAPRPRRRRRREAEPSVEATDVPQVGTATEDTTLDTSSNEESDPPAGDNDAGSEPAGNEPAGNGSADNEPAGNEPEPAQEDRGPYSPAQYDGDGWNDLPVQMRG